MPETIERSEPESAGADPSATDVRPRRWTQTHTIWALMLLSLTPGVAIALFRDQWLELSGGVKGTVYLLSAILIVAACTLTLIGGGTQSEKPNSVPSNHDS